MQHKGTIFEVEIHMRDRKDGHITFLADSIFSPRITDKHGAIAKAIADHEDSLRTVFRVKVVNTITV